MTTKQAKESQDSKPVKLRILDKEVQIACKPGEENDLAKAAAHVDKSMRELRMRNTSASNEKLAIVTAINAANALLQTRTDKGDSPAVTEQLASINAKLEELLED